VVEPDQLVANGELGHLGLVHMLDLLYALCCYRSVFHCDDFLLAKIVPLDYDIHRTTICIEFLYTGLLTKQQYTYSQFSLAFAALCLSKGQSCIALYVRSPKKLRL
jgi:hypothetical protein